MGVNSSPATPGKERVTLRFKGTCNRAYVGKAQQGWGVRVEIKLILFDHIDRVIEKKCVVNGVIQSAFLLGMVCLGI